MTVSDITIWPPGACSLNNYRFVIYRKWSDFVECQCLFYCQSLSLALINTLAYYRILTLSVLFCGIGPCTCTVKLTGQNLADATA